MTAPLMPTVPSGRPSLAAGSDNGGPESAEPFADALNSALSGRRNADERVERPGRRHAYGGHSESHATGRKNPAKPDAASDAPADPATGRQDGGKAECAADGPTPAGNGGTDASAAAMGLGGVGAALWAMALGAATGGPQPAPAAATPTNGVGGVGGAPATGGPQPAPAAAAPTNGVAGVAGAAATGAPTAGAGTVPAISLAADGLPRPVTPTTEAAAADGAPVAASPADRAHVDPPGPPGAEVRTNPGPQAPSAAPSAFGATAGPKAADSAAPAAPVPPAGSQPAALAAAGVTVVESAPAVPVPVPAPIAHAADDSGTNGPSAGASGTPVSGNPAPVAAGGSLSANSGGAGQDAPGSGSSDGNGPAGTTPVGPAVGPALAAPAPVAEVDPALAPAAPVPVSGQVARHVAVLRGAPDGSQSMTLVLHPERLGPVEVHVTISQGTLDLNLRGAHEHGRAALLEALPDLRRDLQTAGLSLSRLEVDRDTGGAFAAPQQNPGERRGQQDRTDSPVRPWPRAADTEESRLAPRPVHRSPERGLDLRV